MSSIVTGIFLDEPSATKAVANLTRNGHCHQPIRLVTATTADRHEFITLRTRDTHRAILLGLLFGAIGGAGAAVALVPHLGSTQSVLFAAVAIGGGALLGSVTGSATRSQLRAELESQVNSGMALVGVTTDRSHLHWVLDQFAAQNGSSIVTTPMSFTATAHSQRGRSP